MKYMGAEAGSNDLIKIIAFLIIAVISLVLILPWIVKQFFSSAKDTVSDIVSDVVSIPGKAVQEKLNYQESKMELYSGQEAGAYREYFSDLPLLAQLPVSVGNVITPSEVLIAAAEKGTAVGRGYNEQRGTLSMADVPRYNQLSSEERLAYNRWGAEQNRGKTGFYYAPSIDTWIQQTGGDSSIMSVPFALWKGMFG